MSDKKNGNGKDEWEEKQIPLKDVVLSNSWALQAILSYLEELNPGAKDRIWEFYQSMKSMQDAALDNSSEIVELVEDESIEEDPSKNEPNE